MSRSIRRLSRLTTIAVAVLLGVGSISTASSGAPTTVTRGGQPKPTIVFVHGAFADASGFATEIAALQSLGYPVLVGASRKRLIDLIAQVPLAADRDPGTLALHLHAARCGAAVVRAHAAAAHVQALRVQAALTQQPRMQEARPQRALDSGVMHDTDTERA